MSTPEAKPAETTATTAKAPKSSAVSGIMKMLIPALLAAGASYGGARAASAHAPAAAPEAPVERRREPKPPGPTVALDPFLLTILDAKGKGHAMKLTIAIEFEKPEKGGGEEGKEGEAMKPFAPRIRDAILSYVRAMSYEEASDGAHMEKVRTEMLERCHGAGAVDAVKILVTDFVLQ
ncbi:MAG: hypothetical protein JWP97_6626 [Labilithrix sp.]|nr:hypothetical protein [Labilithrix sp.]